jgi:nitrite reductase (NO-forming)
MWTNNDTTPHTATASNASEDSQLFDSGLLSPGKTFEVTFDKSGSYHYQCMLHPFMRGVVMVGLSNTATFESSTCLSII